LDFDLLVKIVAVFAMINAASYLAGRNFPHPSEILILYKRSRLRSARKAIE
jgi:hypothetical protein